jgi:hypothetical protein
VFSNSLCMGWERFYFSLSESVQIYIKLFENRHPDTNIAGNHFPVTLHIIITKAGVAR